MHNDSQTRKWQITINNPVEKNYTHDVIIDILKSFKSIIYFCLSDEIGENGTFHTHIFCAFSSGVRFSTMLNKFNGSHFEMCSGSSSDNRDYVFKIGKWLNNKKNDTNLSDTHFEYGELPIERQGKRSDLDDLYDMINSGMSTYDIISAEPLYIQQLDKIDKTRQIILSNQFKDCWRDLEVSYIYGETGSGKTRGIMEKYGYSNVYRVTDYMHPFDGYNAQDVILFDEFRTSLSISDMLKYLDGYPLELPSRYNNKCACYTKVFICSNISLFKQYPNIQTDEPATFKAFLRRIKSVKKYTKENTYVYSIAEYLQGFHITSSVPKEFQEKQ